MKKIFLISLSVIILVWGWFAYVYFNPQLPLSQKVLSIVGIDTITGEVAQVANPASIFCEHNSGALEIITDLSGWQSWLCHLTSGTVCEEWAYMRGECPETINRDTPSNQVDTTKVVYKNSDLGFMFSYPKKLWKVNVYSVSNDMYKNDTIPAPLKEYYQYERFISPEEWTDYFILFGNSDLMINFKTKKWKYMDPKQDWDNWVISLRPGDIDYKSIGSWVDFRCVLGNDDMREDRVFWDIEINNIHSNTYYSKIYAKRELWEITFPKSIPEECLEAGAWVVDACNQYNDNIQKTFDDALKSCSNVEFYKEKNQEIINILQTFIFTK